MRSIVALRLGLVLFATEFVVASPCKPISATTVSESISVVSTETSSAILFVSSTTDVSATSIMPEPTADTSASSSLEAPSSAITERTETTSFVAEPSSIESTTAESTTTEATNIATSTTESIVMPTFSLFATGDSDVEGDGLHTYDTDHSVAVFDPNLIFGDASVRSYTIDSQRRLVNDQGYFLCGYYNAVNTDLNAPAAVGTCASDGPRKMFLNCELSSDLSLRCGIPGQSCVFNPNGNPICEDTGATWGTWSTGVVLVGHGLKIGPIDTPDTYDRIGLRII